MKDNYRIFQKPILKRIIYRQVARPLPTNPRDPDSRFSTTFLTDFSRMLDDFRQKLGKMRPRFVDDPRWTTEILIHIKWLLRFSRNFC